MHQNQPFRFNQNEIVWTVVIAIIIITGIGLGLSRANKSPMPATPAAIVWPTVPPTFTPSPPPGATTAPSTLTPTSTPTAPPTATLTPTPSPTPTPTPIVVGWKELGYLTTVQYTLQTVVEVEREKVIIGPISSKDKVLLLAVGNVQAGIDVSHLSENNVTINGTSARLTLPRAQITSVELLPNETKIYDSNRGWFQSDYAGIEVEALNEARRQLEGWAINRVDIYDQAETLARLQLTDFLRQLGFEEIDITFENNNGP